MCDQDMQCSTINTIISSNFHFYNVILPLIEAFIPFPIVNYSFLFTSFFFFHLHDFHFHFLYDVSICSNHKHGIHLSLSTNDFFFSSLFFFYINSFLFFPSTLFLFIPFVMKLTHGKGMIMWLQRKEKCQ